MSARLLASFLGVALLAGCGDRNLWARYRAERDLWLARRQVERIQVNPSLAGPEAFDDAIAAFQRVEDRFPLRQWATPERLRNRRARDLATLSAEALIA